MPSSSEAIFGESSFLTTVSAWASIPVLLPLVTVTEPSLATVISLSVNPEVLFASKTACLTAAFSSSVNEVGSPTTVTFGAFKLIVFVVSSFFTVFSGAISL